MLESKVVHVSESGKSVIAQVEQVLGDIMVRKSGFVQLAKTGSKKKGDTLTLPWSKVKEVKREIVDEETGEIATFTWLEEA